MQDNHRSPFCSSSLWVDDDFDDGDDNGNDDNDDNDGDKQPFGPQKSSQRPPPPPRKVASKPASAPWSTQPAAGRMRGQERL